MVELESWNWGIEKREVADLNALTPGGEQILYVAVSPDGERLGAVVEMEPDRLRVVANGEPWADELEKALQLQFTADGRLLSLVRVDDEWTVGVDGELWPERWEFVWNPKLTPDGSAIAVQIKRDMAYSIAVNGKAWEENFFSLREYALSDDGQHVAATVQVEELPEADIFKFLEGTWGLAVDGKAWAQHFLNVYGPILSPDGQRVAAEVRTDVCDYTVAENEKLWATPYGCVWEPIFRGTDRIVMPVRQRGAWTLAENDKPVWDGRYVQLWNTVASPDGARLAAVVAPSYGRWTIAVDDRPWPFTVGDLVMKPHFSPDGRRVAAIVKDDNRWTMAVDGQPWSSTFDMIWDPVFSPNGELVAAKVDRDGHYSLAINGRPWGQQRERLWDPVFSSDGQKLLVRGVADGKYLREVIPVTEIIG